MIELIRREFISLLGGAAFLGIAICCFITSSAQAIDCLSALDHAESGWWSWREIDGRKCWFKKVDAVPAKSAFRWPERDKEAPLTQAPRQQGSASIEPTEANAASSPQIEVVRVKPIEAKEQNYRLGDGHVRLLEGLDLSGSRGIGGLWEAPASVRLQTDTFDMRYGEWSDH